MDTYRTYTRRLHQAAKQGDLEVVDKLIQAGCHVDTARQDRITSLHLAAGNGHLKIIDRLIQAGCNVDAATEKGITSLHLAAMHGHLEIVDRLARAECDVKAATGKGNTSLHLVAENGHLEIVDRLIQAGCDVDAATEQGITSLHLAAMHGHLEIVDILIQAECDVKALDWMETTSLHLAAKHGHLGIVDRLIQAECDVGAADHVGATSLHLAAEHGHLEIVDRLIQAECDVKAADWMENTSLHLAAKHGHLEIVDRLIKAECDVKAADHIGATSLHLAAEHGHLEIVDRLIQAGCNVTAATKDGITSLHLAAEHRHRKIVHLLLQAESDPLDASQDGITSLHLAAEHGHLGIVQLLLLAGSDPLAATRDGTTSLHLAAEHRHRDVVHLLLQAENDPHGASQCGITSLHLAAEHGHLGKVELLLIHGSNPNAASKDGITSLHLAAEHGHLRIIELLLTHGSNPNAARKDGITSLHLAAEHGHLDIIHSLLTHRSNPNAAGKDGITSLHLAAEHGHPEIVCLLLQAGGNPLAARQDGITSLHLAAEHGHLEVVDRLIRAKCNLNATSQDDTTSLHKAASSGNVKVVEKLVAHGCNLDAVTKAGFSVLHEAVNGGNPKIVSCLIQAGCMISTGNKTSKGDEAGLIKQLILYHSRSYGFESSPFHLAVSFSRLDMLKHLLTVSMSDSVNRTDSRGRTPLHLAAKMNEYVQVLLRNGADPMCHTDNQWLPLHFAVHGNDAEALQSLIEVTDDINAVTSEGSTALHYAVERNDSEFTDILLNEKGIKLDLMDNCGHAPLHIAVHRGYESTVESLAKCGANLDQYTTKKFMKEKDSAYDETALHIAACRGDEKVVGILIKHGADVNKWSSQCYLALHLASKNKHDSVVEILKGAGDLNSKDQTDRSALHIALINQLEKLVELLLDSSVAIDKPTADGRLPIHVAKVAGHESNKMIQKLVQATNDINVTNQKNGWTALHYAAEMNDTDYINILVRNSAKVNSVSHSKKTPLHVACIYGHIDAVSRLIQLGAQLDACDEKERTPLHFVKQDRQELIIYLTKQLIQKGLQPLHTLIETGNVGAITQLLYGEYGSWVICKADADGLTPVSKACKLGQIEILELLLNNDADVMKKDNAGRTPMHIVIQSFCSHLCDITMTQNYTNDLRTEIYKNIVQRLQEHDESLISTKDLNDEIPLHVMASHRNVRAISHNKEVYEKHYGEESDWLYTMKILADISNPDGGLATANENLINANNKQIQTALHKACGTFTGENMKWLISESNINGKDADGWIPLDLAIHHANTDAICCLMKAHHTNSEDITTVVKGAHMRLINWLKDIKPVSEHEKCRQSKPTKSHILRSWYEALVSADIGFTMTWFHDLGATLPEDPDYTFVPVMPHHSVKTANSQKCYPIKSTPGVHAIIVNMNEFGCRLVDLFRRLDSAIRDVITGSSTTESKASDMISRVQGELARWQTIQKKEAVIKKLKDYPENGSRLHKITDILEKTVNQWKEMTQQQTQTSQVLPGPKTDQSDSSSVMQDLLKQVGDDLSTWDTNLDEVSFPEKRKGSEIDVKRMKKLFQQLQFKVSHWSNCTMEQLEANIQEERLSDEHKASDAFVFVMMSHGTRGYIKTSDNQDLSIEKDIEDKFDGENCPDLEGKPKLFFIQACQEEKAQKAAAEAKSADEVPIVVNTERHPKSDIIEIYTTYPAQSASRDRNHGSWGVEEFVFICEMFSHKCDLPELHTKMNQLLIKRMCKYIGLRQVSQLRNSLTKRFYLTPR